MNREVDQAAPTGAPTVGMAESGTLEAALAAPREHRIELVLKIAGGLAGERYDFEFKIDSAGGSQCGMDCELSGRHVERRSVDLGPEEVASTMRSFAPQMMIAVDEERSGGFPPCSLIGRLEMTVDGQRRVHFFMADQGQAETVGYEPPPYVKSAVDRLFQIAEARLQMDNLRP